MKRFLALLTLLVASTAFGQKAVNRLPDNCSPGDKVILKAAQGTKVADSPVQGTYTCDGTATTSPTFPWVWNIPIGTVGINDTSGLPANAVLFNNGGVPGGSTNLTFDPSVKHLTLTAADPSATPFDLEFSTTTDNGATGLQVNANIGNDSFFPSAIGAICTWTGGVGADANDDSCMYSDQTYTGSGTKHGFWGYSAQPAVTGSGSVTQLSGMWVYAPASGANPSVFDYGAQDLSGAVGTYPNAYYEWFDSRGVYRIKEDGTHNSVGQAIPALYNPQFTKYTPGLANYERIVEQWDTNIAQIGPEKGGTGTLRGLELTGASLKLDAVHSTTGTRYLCVGADGTVSASASACSGT